MIVIKMSFLLVIVLLLNEAGDLAVADFTSRWCTEHGLSEHTATALRGEGFLSQATVDSLTDDVIPSLGLRGKGQECLLRKVISQLNTSTGKLTDVAVLLILMI